MLNPEFKAKWVAALLSGHYAQAVGQLSNGSEGYCCLGVAEAACGIGRAHSGDALLYGVNALDVGLDTGVQRELARRNDNGHSFEEIAQYIQDNL